MSLLDCFLDIISDWKSAFSKRPSYYRAVLLALASLSVLGRACLSRIIGFLGLDQRDWSAHYKLFSRAQWSSSGLFFSIAQKALPLIDEPYIAVAFDDTRLKKTGKKIKTAFYQKDPLSPPFRVNLMYGLRFLQGSLLMPMYQKNDQPPRGLPIVFKEVPAVKKPGKHATKEELEEYAKAIKETNLSTHFVDTLKQTRALLDAAKGADKLLIAAVDGSFCNRTCMGNQLERTCVVARARRDAKLCFKATGHHQRVYGERKFTPESVRQDGTLPWQETEIYHGGRWRQVRYKEVEDVLWENGTKQKPLKLIILAPTPYRLTKMGKTYYRKPAYLLAQKAEVSIRALIQKYFDRWQIEVNHQEEKDILGVGQAQVRADKSVSRQPAFVVAAYSALLLAGIICFNDQRGEQFMVLPKWRRRAKRPSCLDLVQLLRKEIDEKGEVVGQIIDVKKAIFKSAA